MPNSPSPSSSLSPPSSPPLSHHSDGMAAKMAAGGLSCMIISGGLTDIETHLYITITIRALALTHQSTWAVHFVRVLLVLNPMDVIKIRLQNQNQGMSIDAVHLYSNAKYKGMTQGLVLIYREEGYVRGLMRGLTPSLLREASYSSIRMGLYDYFKGVLSPTGTKKHEMGLRHKIAAGILCGALGSSIATPLDLTKIRFQSFSPTNPNPYKHTLDALLTTAKTQGIKGLYKGIGPTTLRAAVLNGANLSSYDHSKSWMIHTQKRGDNVYTHLFASLVSGLVTTTAANPFDVIKTRIMTDGTAVQDHGERKYKSAWDCAYKTARNEGLMAFSQGTGDAQLTLNNQFYSGLTPLCSVCCSGKGWLPNYFRLGPHFILSLPLAEFIRVQLGADTF